MLCGIVLKLLSKFSFLFGFYVCWKLLKEKLIYILFLVGIVREFPLNPLRVTPLRTSEWQLLCSA